MTDKRDRPGQPPSPRDERPLADDGGLDDTEAPSAARIVDALRASGTAEELQDEAHYRRLFDQAGPIDGPTWPEQLVERKPLRTIVIGGRAAAALAACLVAGVGAAAAYTGSLPRGLQSRAHQYIGAQAPRTGSATAATSQPSRPSVTSSPPVVTPDATSAPLGTSPTTRVTTSKGPVGPDIDGVKGRCTAWSKGGLATTSSAYRRLVADAGGVDQIGAYCAARLEQDPPATHTEKSDNPPKAPKAPKKLDTAKAKGKAKEKAGPHGKSKSAPPGQLKKPPL